MRMSDATTGRTPSRAAVDRAIPGAARSERLERAAQSAHVLCEALWEALEDELTLGPQRGVAANMDGAPTPRTAALAERLVDVAETFALLASGAPDPAAPK